MSADKNRIYMGMVVQVKTNLGRVLDGILLEDYPSDSSDNKLRVQLFGWHGSGDLSAGVRVPAKVMMYQCDDQWKTFDEVISS